MGVTGDVHPPPPRPEAPHHPKLLVRVSGWYASYCSVYPSMQLGRGYVTEGGVQGERCDNGVCDGDVTEGYMTEGWDRGLHPSDQKYTPTPTPKRELGGMHPTGMHSCFVFCCFFVYHFFK